ncbi:MAG: type II toxin-antitoxin system MqsR family toxin [Firmicutes bacterium]|nr:type II toxin-antitoxin system MqsR family toxin [Bacillota bacterium]
MTVVSRTQVRCFLDRAKALIVEGKWNLVKRQKNLDALAFMGWTEEVVLETLCSLAVENYVTGPEGDRGFPGEEVWTFGIETDNGEYYIKLKVRTGDGLVCLSFHPAEYPLRYPYRG